jgi:hypothetical protein
MASASFQHLPLWARVAIERLDACTGMRTQRQLVEFLDAYAKTYGVEVDDATRAATLCICRDRFGDTFKTVPTPMDIPPGTLRLVRLAREGSLRPGDLVATQRLGECQVVRIHTPHSIEVRCTASGGHYLLSGMWFGADARVIAMADAPGPAR